MKYCPRFSKLWMRPYVRKRLGETIFPGSILCLRSVKWTVQTYTNYFCAAMMWRRVAIKTIKDVTSPLFTIFSLKPVIFQTINYKTLATWYKTKGYTKNCLLISFLKWGVDFRHEKRCEGVDSFDKKCGYSGSKQGKRKLRSTN